MPTGASRRPRGSGRIVESERESSRGVEAGVELADRACDREDVKDRDPEGGGLVLQRQGRSALNLDQVIEVGTAAEVVVQRVAPVDALAVPEVQTCRGEWLARHRNGERPIWPSNAEVEEEVARLRV